MVVKALTPRLYQARIPHPHPKEPSALFWRCSVLEKAWQRERRETSGCQLPLNHLPLYLTPYLTLCPQSSLLPLGFFLLLSCLPSSPSLPSLPLNFSISTSFSSLSSSPHSPYLSFTHSPPFPPFPPLSSLLSPIHPHSPLPSLFLLPCSGWVPRERASLWRGA